MPDPAPVGAHPRAWLGAVVAAVVVVAVALVVLLGSGGGPKTPAVASLPPLHAHRAGPESMFTAALELTDNPVGTLNNLQSLGVDRVHIYMHWADIAPDPTSRHRPAFNAADPAAYPAKGWAAFDAVIRDAKARGIGVDLALVAPPPLWAAGKGAPGSQPQPEWHPSAAEFGEFVHAAGVRYGGTYVPSGASRPLPRVDFWSIWNEPNLGTQLAPEARAHGQIEVAPDLYRGIVDAAWSAFAATGHGHDTLLIGELAPAGESHGVGNFNNMPPLRFLRALYCVGADYRPLQGAAARIRGCPATTGVSARFRALHPGLFRATGFADHPYPQGLAPDTVTPDEPDYAELAAIGKLERTLDTLQRVYGSHARFPIWSTEFGYQTTPPDTESGTVSPTTAASWLNWAEYLTWSDPRQRSYDQYQLTDSPAGNFATGLLTATGAPKPGYVAYRMPLYLPATATTARHPLVVWGCVRPAPDAARTSHHPQQVQIQFKPDSGSGFTTVQTVKLTGPHGYFEVRQTFSGSGTVRLAWSYPRGPQIFSREQAVTVG
ncbi:MAG: hypothetical protein ACR2NR_18010 [Solirubrobacteraceae bacterium]